MDTVRQKAAEEERLLRLTHLGTANGKRKPCTHGAVASSKRPRQNSHNITDTVFRSRSGQIQDPRKVQRKITEHVIRGLRPCGSRKILEHAEATDAYCRLQHMSYMEPSSDQSKLLCLWSLKDIIGQRIQLLNVKSFARSHEDGSKKIPIDVQPGDVVILQTRYNITGLKWAPQNDDDDRSDHILYTTTRSLRNNQSLAILRRLDSSALHNFRGNEYVLGKKATWSCAWNRHARQIGVGSEKMSVLVDAETRLTRQVHADKSDVLSLVFSRQVCILLRRFPEFSISTFSGCVLLLSLLVSYSCFFLLHHSTSVSVVLSFGIHHFHVLITASSSVFPSTRPNHISVASLIFSLMFTTPAHISSFPIFSILFIPIIHVNILISVLSSKFCSAFLSGQVSLPYIRTGLMTVLYMPF